MSAPADIRLMGATKLRALLESAGLGPITTRDMALAAMVAYEAMREDGTVLPRHALGLHAIQQVADGTMAAALAEMEVATPLVQVGAAVTTAADLLTAEWPSACELVLQMVADDITTCIGERGADWLPTELSQETLEALQAIESAMSRRARHLPLSAAACEAIGERMRQVDVEGWTPEHDDQHAPDELPRAAAAYILHDLGMPVLAPAHVLDQFKPLWPWGATDWKPKDRRSNLKRATALLLAAMEQDGRLTAYLHGQQLLERAKADPRLVTGSDAVDEPWARDDERTLCLLLLCGGHDVTAEIVATWTDEQCQQAEDWAAREHLSASDNDDVQRVPMPAHVKAHPPKPGVPDLWSRT